MLKEFWEFIAPVISDWNDKVGEFRVSIGRVSFWITLSISIVFYWAKGIDVPTNLWGLLVALLLYVTGTKSLQTFKDVKLGNGNNVTEPEPEPKPEG